MNGPLQKADISFVMEEDGKPLLSHQPDLALIPASNMKLIISAAALISEGKELLSPLQTYCDGKINNGVLDGNLYLDFCGSPVFSARFPVNRTYKERHKLLEGQVSSYAGQLEKAGIKRIEGALKLTFNRWKGSPENRHYTAAAAASFNENTLDTFVKKGKMITSPADPAVYKFQAYDKVKTQDKVADNLIRYNPNADSQDYWRISHTSAVEYTKLMVLKSLNNMGITFTNQAEPGEKRLLFETEPTEQTSEFIKPLNTWSDNYRAEILALQLSRVYSGAAEYKTLNSSVHNAFKTSGLKLTSLKCSDGSGLSRKNRVSAADLNRLLKFMSSSKYSRDYISSLAEAGKTGTLIKRFKKTPFDGSFYGKTGTLNGVSALSGYWLREKRPTITFAFIGNGAENEIFWNALEKFAASLLFMT
jgi:D-alanyl-D-alanine carboxypeptidase/D-alanyl-D-alanine-endopeptidase (penicillin-binding protein 4)